jgi:putative ABC transport system substrate-binding protein
MTLPVDAAELLIIQSQHRPAYDQAVRLIQNSCARDSETMVLSDYTDLDLARIVREERPAILITIGDNALKAARKLRSMPIVFTLALNVDENSLGDNISGVTMNATPENYLKLFKKLQLRRIGILYDPHHSGAYLERSRKAAAGFGIEMVSIKVRSAREVPTALDKLKQSNVDSIWMLPDSTAVSPESVDAYFLFAQQQNLPIISFARGYLAKGALAVLEVSRQMISEQSCSQIKKLRKGTLAKEPAIVDVGEATLFTNKSVADKLEINLSGVEKIFPRRE